MTAGNIKTGTLSFTTKFHYGKAWQGVDGRTIAGRFTRKPKWNGYVMKMGRFKASNPNKIGTINLATGVYTERVNHTWNASGTGSPGSIGYATNGDGSFSVDFPTSLFNSVWTDREELALLSKVLKKAKGHNLHLGVSLAEVDKLAGTVLGTIRSLIYGFNDLRAFKFANFARRFGASPPRKDRVQRLRTLDISGRFLEMRYAWEPTIADVYEAAKAFESISNGPRQLYTRATGRKSVDGFYFTNYCKVPQTQQIQRTYLFEIYEEMSFARQLGLADPASVTWERIPLSFVFDWFMPIGTYLELIGQVPFMKGRWLRTSSIKWTSAGAFPADTAHSSWGPAQPYPDCDWERFALERVSSSSPPGVPFPSFRVSGAVAGKRVMNAIALAHQLVFGRRSNVVHQY